MPRLIWKRFLLLELFTMAALYDLPMTRLRDVVQRSRERRYGRGYATGSADRR